MWLTPGRASGRKNVAPKLFMIGETYECVKSFCYLGDTLDGEMVEQILLLQLESELDE